MRADHMRAQIIYDRRITIYYLRFGAGWVGGPGVGGEGEFDVL